MESIRWSEKSLPFRTVVDNPAVTKPALVRLGTRILVVGEKLNGEFLIASPYQKKDGRLDISDRTIVLTSRYPGIWKVVSKTTSKHEGLIHRLTTKDLETIHKQDINNARATPRTYICLKEIEAFELIIRSHDPYIVNGHRVERLPRRIGENVEFYISDIGEAEYTPTEGEITSQDYVKAPNARSTKILNALVPGVAGPEHLIRNRVLRTIYCTTKSDKQKRHFLLEVNEQACDIRPIASDGSSELRYLHSTKNLFDYLSTHGNDTTLEVKLIRGDPPAKAVDSDRRMIFRGALGGDRIPLCRLEDFQITLATPDLPVQVRLPSASETGWRSLADIRNAELQCMQLSLALLSRHESDVFVHIESDKIGVNYLQQSYREEQTSNKVRSTEERVRKHSNEKDKDKNKEKHSNPNTLRTKLVHQPRSLQTRPSLSVDNRQPTISTTTNHQSSPRITRLMPLTHPASDRLYREEEKRVAEANRTVERMSTEFGEKLIIPPRSILRAKPSTSAKSSSSSMLK